MTTYKTAELEGQTLDAAVCKALGWTWWESKHGGYNITRADGSSYGYGNFSPKFDVDTGEKLPPVSIVDALTIYGDACYSEDWALAGPIIERERIMIEPAGSTWFAYVREDRDGVPEGSGPTPLIAAMRAYVASKLGETVDLP